MLCREEAIITDLLFRLRAVFDPRSAERSLDDELRAHLDHEVEKLLRAGMSPEEASRKARWVGWIRCRKSAATLGVLDFSMTFARMFVTQCAHCLRIRHFL